MGRSKTVEPAPAAGETRKRRIGAAALRKWMGRPLAAQRELATRLMAILAVDFEREGPDTVAKLRLENPTNYLRLVASLLPKDLDDENLLGKVSDEELQDVILRLRARAPIPGGARRVGRGSA
jgi:hypothetical protein